MIAYYFRFIDENGQPTGWVGFAAAPSMMDLFWEIDKYGNPHFAEVQKAQSFSWCAQLNSESSEYYDHEVTEDCESLDPDKWRKPRWPDNPFVKFTKDAEEAV